ncbi:glycosyltransferase [Paenibacillus sp. NPDC058071]|uniref:glycosyltransferase n=1 Tax=Paenibacillus sp. NPDC058071 TaxID=3346326 RepID=UPI0036DBDD57
MDILFAKYNRERLPEFQTETVIYRLADKMYSKKKALFPEAVDHINAMGRNYEILSQTMSDVEVAKCFIEGEAISFVYSDAPLLDSYLYRTIVQNNKEQFFHYLGVYKKMILNQANYVEETFESSESFEHVFKQKVSLRQVYCMQYANVDLTFDNLTLSEAGTLTVIDYEWVFPFGIPVDFIVYRAINEFVAKYMKQITGFIEINAIYSFFELDIARLSLYEEMEKGFQNYVFGENRLYKSTYRVSNDVIALEGLEQRNVQLNHEVESKNQEIASTLEKYESANRQIEEARLQSEDYKNKLNLLHEKLAAEVEENKLLEQQMEQQMERQNQELRNKDGHIEQLLLSERELHNIHGSGGWKLLKRYYKTRDALVPSNSKRRVFLKLFASLARNPKFVVSKMNKQNLKKLRYYLNAEDSRQLENRIDSFVERHLPADESKAPIQLFKPENYTKLIFEEHETPLVSIVIPVYNQFDYTYACLQSILTNTQGIAYEVIIADDMSTDETVNIGQYADNINVVRDGENRGFLLNCNNAAKQAKGKYIFFLNNDTNVQSNWLDHLLSVIESDPTTGMVGSKLIYPDGRQQEAGGIIWSDASGWNYGRLDDPEKPEYNYVKEADYISGAAILIRTSLWIELGGFDERYVPAYFEDTDLAFAVRALGYKVLLQPKSVIVHFEGISHGTDTGSGIKSYQVKNKEKFLEKWKIELEKNQFANAEHVFLARDRSRNKKTIVVVDHYVPHYDKDAGGRCTHLYMKLMVSLGYRVIFIGDNFFQHEPYTSELQQIGIEVLYGNSYAKNIHQWIKTNGEYIDYVYLNRPHISIKYIDSFKKNTQAKIIYFGHDLHYLRELRNYELTRNPALLKSSEEWKEIEFKLFSLADVIHVVGSFEQQVLQKLIPDKPIRNIPLFPYNGLYDRSTNDFADRKHLLFVGGFNHKPNYDGILWFIENVLPAIKREIPDIKLFIVGSNPPNDLLEQQSSNIIVTGFVSDEELEHYYNSCRVVIVPLRFGAGVKGKVIEALYYQVPIVTTAIGAEGLEISEGIMTVCDSETEFANAVVKKYNDELEWKTNANASRQFINEFFTVDAAKEILSLDISNIRRVQND